MLGINETSHDAAVALVEDGEILFAGHAERYSKRKNDWYVNAELLSDALSYGVPDMVAYYERPGLKAARLALRGGRGHWRPRALPKNLPVKYFRHHYSHAAAGYFTSKFDDAVVVVLDAIGEWNTSTVWSANGNRLELVYRKNYPFSFGLFYSAFTQLVGLKPNEEEYIMMGMAAYGDAGKYFARVNDYFPDIHTQCYNFHRGIVDWPAPRSLQDKFDIAAAAQLVYRSRLLQFMQMARRITNKRRLVFMGGCALNCAANVDLWDVYDDVWIMPNPGDAGSALGAAAAAFGRHLNWRGPYLGHDLGRPYPVQDVLRGLHEDGIVAVASGRAEYGPRALGNRSILADPRRANVKDLVNAIKRRELFRPFAPVVLEEHARDWFDLPYPSPYMQYAARCLRPETVPAVVHADGTSRVQTVSQQQHAGLYDVLTKWHSSTGVPLLLNTSLNVKGQPLVNDLADVAAWESTYGVRVLV